ncbi:MAG: hypothetical protein NZ891_08600, partial [bacterium]|nr:hypothetical protein [bacterium]MDW8164781.1 hypothetical protein [Candidatus Omnitrophota bacterium]
WEDLNLFIIGGGSEINELVEYLTIPLDQDEKNNSIVTCVSNTKLKHIKKENNPIDENFNIPVKIQYLLWVAAGLSIHYRKWIKYFKPSEVEPIVPVIKKFNAEERLRQYDG